MEGSLIGWDQRPAGGRNRRSSGREEHEVECAIPDTYRPPTSTPSPRKNTLSFTIR